MKPTSLDNPILFTKSVALSLALIVLCLFLRHLQDCGYSTKFRKITRDLESGELLTTNSCKRKGLGFGCIEKTSLQMQSWSMGERRCGWNLGRILITGISCLLLLSHTWREQRGPQKTFSNWDTQYYHSFERRKEEKFSLSSIFLKFVLLYYGKLWNIKSGPKARNCKGWRKRFVLCKEGNCDLYKCGDVRRWHASWYTLGRRKSSSGSGD
jgi:hypothetical protein